MHHLWGKFLEMTIDLSVKFDPPKNGSHLNDPWRTQHQNPAISGVSPLSCVPCLAAKLISFFLPVRITFRGPIRNQSTLPGTSGVSPLTGKSWKTSRNSTTKQAGFRAWGENPKENGIPPVFQLIISWAVLGRCLCSICAEDSQKEEKQRPATRFPGGA